MSVYLGLLDQNSRPVVVLSAHTHVKAAVWRIISLFHFTRNLLIELRLYTGGTGGESWLKGEHFAMEPAGTKLLARKSNKYDFSLIEFSYQLGMLFLLRLSNYMDITSLPQKKE